MTKAPAFKEPATADTAPAAAAAPKTAKMLIFLANGKPRLLTFTLPKESCTLEDVFKEYNIPFEENTHIQCMQITGCAIDYFVAVGYTIRIEDMLKDHPLVGLMKKRFSRKKKSQSGATENN